MTSSSTSVVNVKLRQAAALGCFASRRKEPYDEGAERRLVPDPPRGAAPWPLRRRVAISTGTGQYAGPGTDRPQAGGHGGGQRAHRRSAVAAERDAVLR